MGRFLSESRENPHIRDEQVTTDLQQNNIQYTYNTVHFLTPAWDRSNTNEIAGASPSDYVGYGPWRVSQIISEQIFQYHGHFLESKYLNFDNTFLNTII